MIRLENEYNGFERNCSNNGSLLAQKPEEMYRSQMQSEKSDKAFLTACSESDTVYSPMMCVVPADPAGCQDLSGMADLRVRLEKLEAERSAFQQEGVFDLIGNIMGYSCHSEEDGQVKSSMGTLLRSNLMLRQRLEECETELKSAGSQLRDSS